MRNTAVSAITLLGSLLVACDGAGIATHCSPKPYISSTPPTLATAGREYVYYADGGYLCLFFVCGNFVPVRLPPGASLNGHVVSWLPPGSAGGTTARFAIATGEDSCGDRARQDWSVFVYPELVIESLGVSSALLHPGDATTVTAVFRGGAGELRWADQSVPITSGQAVQIPALQASTTFLLIVSNPIGAEARATATVTVVHPPAVAIQTAPALITTGDASTLSWTIGGSFSEVRLDPGNIDVISRHSLEVRPPVTTRYTLRATNVFGESDTAEVDVTVIEPPAIDSFTADPASTGYRGTVDLMPVFRHGTGEVAGLGAAQSGMALNSGELTASRRFVLTVRNATGREVSQELAVAVTGPGTFAPTTGAPLATRFKHTATRLADGRVFIAGGAPDPFDTKALATTEIFDPLTETFAAGPPLLTERFSHSATLLPDGRVLIVGGRHWDSRWELVATAEIYDPASNTVAPAGTVASGLNELIGVALQDGRVLVVDPTTGAEAYDPVTGVFSAVGPFQNRHTSPCTRLTVLADGRVLVADGNVFGFDWSETFTPGPDTFAATDRMSQRCHFATTLLHDGRVLIVGNAFARRQADVFDPATQTYSDAGLPVFLAYDSVVVTLDSGEALVVAGRDIVTSGALRHAQLFDPARDSFRFTGELQDGREYPSATLLYDGRVLVLGGCRAPCVSAELYSP